MATPDAVPDAVPAPPHDRQAALVAEWEASVADLPLMLRGRMLRLLFEAYKRGSADAAEAYREGVMAAFERTGR